MKPTIGRIVIYRSRTGNYDVPAIVTCTAYTLAPVGVEMWHASNGEKGVPPLSSPEHLHLAVLTPGIPGLRAGAQDFKTESPHGRSENVNGVYQEWDIAHDQGETLSEASLGREPQPGTWRWPVRS